jgi:hypothetical protein
MRLPKAPRSSGVVQSETTTIRLVPNFSTNKDPDENLSLIPVYAVLVFALGMVRAWFFPAMTPDIGHALWLIPALAAAGTFFVIPTAGEVPIIQVLQQFGLGGAGAAALLITLPTVSLPSLAMWRGRCRCARLSCSAWGRSSSACSLPWRR